MSLTQWCIVHPLSQVAVDILFSNIDQPTFKEIKRMCEYWWHNNFRYHHHKYLVHWLPHICYFRGFQNNVCHFSCILPTSLYLGCIAHFNRLFLVMGLAWFLSWWTSVLIKTRSFCRRSKTLCKKACPYLYRTQTWIKLIVCIIWKNISKLATSCNLRVIAVNVSKLELLKI